jgi:hypothetical protein
MGRFYTPDPYQAVSSAAVNPADPSRWNRYPYVGNDPINYADPTGLDKIGVYDGSGLIPGLTTFSVTVTAPYPTDDSSVGLGGVFGEGRFSVPGVDLEYNPEPDPVTQSNATPPPPPATESVASCVASWTAAGAAAGTAVGSGAGAVGGGVTAGGACTLVVPGGGTAVCGAAGAGAGSVSGSMTGTLIGGAAGALLGNAICRLSQTGGSSGGNDGCAQGGCARYVYRAVRQSRSADGHHRRIYKRQRLCTRLSLRTMWRQRHQTINYGSRQREHQRAAPKGATWQWTGPNRVGATLSLRNRYRAKLS